MKTTQHTGMLVLVERLSDGNVRRIPLVSAQGMIAAPGARYALIDPVSNKAPEGLVLKRKGKALAIALGDQELVQLEQFYDQPDAAFVPDASVSGSTLSGTTVTPASPVQASGDTVLWSATDGGATPAFKVDPALVGIGLGGVALAAAAGGGGGGGSGDGGGGDDGGKPPASTRVTGTVVAGPVLEGNGLTVIVYQADGVTKLGEAKVQADGTFSLDVGDYVGVVIARLIDSDTGADHLDEATGVPTDISANLFSMEVVSEPNSTVVMNIDVLTTLAYTRALEAADGAPLTAGDVASFNQAIATLFGLPALSGITIVPVNGGDFDDSDGFSDGELYGALLAAFSGADLANGGDAQATIEQILAGLTIVDGVATLDEAAQTALLEGAAAAGITLDAGLPNLIDTYAPSFEQLQVVLAIDENSGAGQVVHTASASDPSGVRYSLKGADAALFTIDAATGAVTLVANPDHEAKASYGLTVVATDAAGNSSEQGVRLTVGNLDEVAPTITSGAVAAAIDENSGAGQLVYTATATDAADTSGGFSFSLKPGGDAAAFTIDATTGKVVLVGNPDVETQGNYSFTVVATDAAGHASEQAVTLAIGNLDEVAPTIVSATSISVDENIGTGQVVYTAVADDSADISGGITYSLKPTVYMRAPSAGDEQYFTIDAATGAVTLVGNPDHDTQSGYVITVVATDAAGHSTEQVVTLNINDLDEIAPTITSGTVAAALDENSGADQLVYTVVADDTADISGGVSYSLKPVDDAAAFTIDATTGAVTLVGNPDHETKASYSFTVVATDAAGNASEQTITLAVNDLDEVAPTITSGSVATAIDENSGANQVVYTVTATDTGDISGGVTYGLKAGDDAAAFTIDATTGAVTLVGNPDHETKASYSFTVIATDAAGLSAEKAVTLAVDNLDEVAPTITSGGVATAIDENSGANQVVYTVTATDTGDISGGITYSLKPTVFMRAPSAGDEQYFTIDSTTGAVTLVGNPDHETQSSYTITVVATDAAGLSDEKTVTLAINDLDEVAPTITSGSVATAIDENSAANQVVYTVTATDAGDISGGVTYSLKAVDDAAAFTIDAATGAVTLVGNPDHETKASYGFTVIATDAAGNKSEKAVTLAVNNLDEVAPTITSGSVATAIDENSAANQVVYTVTATDNGDIGGGVTYGLKAGGDAAAFTINAATGAVTLVDSPDHEAKASYSFTVVATDAAGLSDEKTVTLAINDLDEVAPTITSGGVATAIDESSGANQVVYTVTATDTGDISGGVTYSLKAGDDAAAFTINATTGAVTLVGNPDHETQSSYTITVVATDAAGLSDEKTVTLAINDLDEVAPTITSGSVATAIDENSAANQVVYTVTATDTGDISGGVTYSLKAVDDAAAFTIDAATGAVTLVGNPDHETKASYGFTVVATDAAGNKSEKAVTLAVNNLDEVAPTITSGATATAIRENSGANQVVYTAVADDSGDISAGVTYSLANMDDSEWFSINATTGAVTMLVNPDYETKSSYTFHVVATDAANLSVQKAVTLAIEDQVDETAPTILSIEVASADGLENDVLNVGDFLVVRVTFSEDIALDFTGSSPRLALDIGGTTRYASLNSTATSTMTFGYTIQAGDTDANGFSIPANAFELQGAVIKDLAGNLLDPTHAALDDQPSYKVDTTAPTLTSSSPADNGTAVAVGSNIVLTFSETVAAGTGNIVISNGTDTRTISVTDTSQVTISGTTVTINPTTDLQEGSTYDVQMASGVLTDAGGNAYAGISDTTTLNFQTASSVNTSVVVFDMAEGVSSSHSGRTFSAGVSYTIYLKVDSNNVDLSTDGTASGNVNATWGTWNGANNLGADDKIVLVGTGTAIKGVSGAWLDSFNASANSQQHYALWWGQGGSGTWQGVTIYASGDMMRSTNWGTGWDNADLWDGSWTDINSGRNVGEVLALQMPGGILTTQGLA